MKTFNELTLQEKTELAKYLVNNWSYNDTYREEVELEIAYDHAVERISNDKSVLWAKTPSNSAEDIMFDFDEA